MPRLRLSLLLAPLALAHCSALRPFAEVRRLVPADGFVEVDGGLVHVEQAGEGEPVVLIHGFGASTYSWRKVLPGLAASHRVVALDLYGFGYTERPRDPARYARQGQVGLVLGLMDRLGLARAHLVGHSYGGAISLALAARHPERVRSLVLIDCAAPTYPDDRRSRAAGLRLVNTFFLRTLALRPRYVEKALRRSVRDDALVTPEMVSAYLDRLRVEGVADAYYGLTAPARSPAEAVDLAKIDVPALVVWGAEDELIPLADGRAAAARMPRADFVVFEETGHMPMEERPEELVRVVTEFLARRR